MLSAVTELCDVKLSQIEDAVGPRSFERGASYARGNRVVRLKWDPDQDTLAGSVVGRGAL
jgi:hypothetical protein